MINKGRTRRWARPTGGAPVATDGGPQPDFGDMSDPAAQADCDHLLWDFSTNKCMDCGLRADPGSL